MKRNSIILLLCLMALCLRAQSDRLSALEAANNLVVKVKGKQLPKYRTVSRLNTLKCYRHNGQLVMGGDTIDPMTIESMRLQPIPRFQLHEDSTSFLSVAQEHALLAFRRTLQSDQWNPLVLPLDLSGRQLLEAFGADAQLAVFAGVNDEGVAELRSVKLENSHATVLEAGTFALLRPARQPDVAEGKRTSLAYGSGRVAGPVYLIDDVSMTAGQKSPAYKSILSEGKKVRIRVYGTYAQKKIFYKSTPFFTLDDDGLFSQHADSVALHGFSCYVTVPTNTDQATMRFIIDGVGEDITATGILAPSTSFAERQPLAAPAVFDLMGRRASEGMLKRGIYVKNGRKIVIR